MAVVIGDGGCSNGCEDVRSLIGIVSDSENVLYAQKGLVILVISV